MNAVELIEDARDGNVSERAEVTKNKHTMSDLMTMQAWPLQRKIQVTQTRLMEWKMQFKGQICISFSSGKDNRPLAKLNKAVKITDTSD